LGSWEATALGWEVVASSDSAWAVELDWVQVVESDSAWAVASVAQWGRQSVVESDKRSAAG